jgi:hypothetical protein
MDPKFNAFRDGILTVNTGIGVLFLMVFRLVGIYIEGYEYHRTFNDTVLLVVVAIVVLSLNIGFIFWGYRKYKKNRLPFKKDRKTKLLTYTEIASSLVCFSLFGTGVYASLSAYYSFNTMVLLLAGLMAFVFMILLYYDSLPEQVADQSPIESSPVAP